MSQSLSRRSFLKCAGSGAVSLAAALLTGVYGSYAHVFQEAVKYLKGVEPDPVYPAQEALNERWK